MECLKPAQTLDAFAAVIESCVTAINGGPGWQGALSYGLWTVAIVAGMLALAFATAALVTRD